MKDKMIRALLIEDDAEDSLLLMRLLLGTDTPSFRFAMESVQTLSAGLEAMSRGGVEVVLLDLMLPDSQGLETLRRVRAEQPDAAVVVLTGLNDEAMGLKALEAGAQDYLVKGAFDVRSLRRSVSFAVHRHRAAAGLKALIERSLDGMLVLDPAGAVLYLNPAARMMLGRSGEALVGKAFPYPVSTDKVREVPLPGGDAERSAQLRAVPVEWRDGPAMLVTLHDITDLRRVARLQAEVKESRRMERVKTELMSAISHEMRSPLTVIKAANINMKDGATGPLTPDQTTMLDLQHNNILRLQRILDNVLDLSRLESGRAVIRPVRLDPRPVVQEVVRGFRLVAGQRGVSVELDASAEASEVWADPDLLPQVLSNLLDNAVRFTHSRVVVGLRALSTARAGAAAGGGAAVAEPGVLFSVADDGRGIPRERLFDVFKRFVQVDRAAGGSEYKGTGLGLAICKEIVERMGGRIWAESGDGQGARFYFTLPARGDEEGD